MNKWIKYSLLILLPIGLLLWAVFDCTSWDEEFTIEDGRLGTAQFTDFEWRFWGGMSFLLAAIPFLVPGSFVLMDIAAIGNPPAMNACLPFSSASNDGMPSRTIKPLEING